MGPCQCITYYEPFNLFRCAQGPPIECAENLSLYSERLQFFLFRQTGYTE